MKSILTIFIFLSLVVSGVAQTRNVVAGTNGAVVSPTNFWSADVTNARSGLGLGTAATNAASAFQPSSATLSNLSLGNGSGLTNVTASSVSSALAISNTTGLQAALDGKLATNGNTTGTASNVTGVVALVNGGTGATNAASARTSLGATTVGANIFTLSNPDEIRFLRLNANNSVSALTAADMRIALSVGTNLGTVTSIGMTVPAIFSLSTPTITSSGTFALTLANQTSRHALLTPNGGGVPAFRGVESDDLPSLAISKITGLQTALDGKLATGGTATLATNVTGVVALANGGTGGTDAATARTGLGATTAGSSMFTLINPSAIRFLRLNNDNTMSALSDSDFRTAIGLGTAATNPATAFQPSSSVLNNLANSNGAGLTNLTAANITGTVALASNVTGTIAISNGGSGTTTAGGARTNFGLGWSALTNLQSSLYSGTATELLGYTTEAVAGSGSLTGFKILAYTNTGSLVIPANLLIAEDAIAAPRNLRHVEIRGTATIGNPYTDDTIFGANYASVTDQLTFTNTIATWSSNAVTMGMPITFSTNTFAAITRTNLSLGATWLTNTVASNFLAAIGAQSTNGNGFGLTNLNASNITGQIPASNISTVNLSNIAGTVVVESGGTGATNAATARTNLGLGATNTVFFNTVSVKEKGLGTLFNGIQWQSMYPSSNGLIQLYGSDAEGTTTFGINIGTMSGATTEVALFNANRITFYEPLEFNNTTNAATTRTNLGLGLSSSVAFSSLTLSNGAPTNLSINLGSTNRGFYATVGPERITTTVGGVAALSVYSSSVEIGSGVGLSAGGNVNVTSNLNLGGPISFINNGNQVINAATSRTNLGLGWSALTNSNAGTGLVSVSTNGEVVSPNNFWQVAPISTTVQYQTNVTATSTNAATNSRNLFLFSLAPTVSSVTNTVTLPTNPATTFEGDRATIIHLATNSANTVTAIRQLGVATNIITLNQGNEAVLFMYRSGAWGLSDNISQVEPIYFSGTNAAGHAAESRTNLGLGSTNDVTFSSLTLSSDLTLGSGDNIVLSTTTGTKIGTATNQLLGFYNKTPITQPSSTGVTTNGFTTGSVSNVHANSTFTGGIGTTAYTISDVVAHLKSLGLLAP